MMRYWAGATAVMSLTGYLLVVEAKEVSLVAKGL
jgi:hypothetical protein